MTVLSIQHLLVPADTHRLILFAFTASSQGLVLPCIVPHLLSPVSCMAVCPAYLLSSLELAKC